jgi:3-oxoacid CoA-transferase subunit A
MIYITGDTHARFERVELFCKENNTSKDDILIILGDAGLNYYCNKKDSKLKEYVSSLPITIFSIHGNHEERPFNIDSYKLVDFCGGKVWIEDEFPNLLFAKDGEVYDFNGVSTLVIGGAYSVDKFYRQMMGYMWFKDEQPSECIKKEVEEKLDSIGWKIDCILSHTTPVKYEPVEWFLSGINQSTVDKSTELWLDTIENKLDYKKWYCGHYHGEKKIDKVEFMFNSTHIFEI